MTKTFSEFSGSELPEGAMPPGRSELHPNFASHDPYAVLGLTRGASAREIKRAYFALVREYPPEQNADTFKLIRAAYEKLRSDEVKAETDLFLFQPPYAWEPRKRKGKLDLDVHVEDVWAQLQRQGDLGRRDFKEDYRTPKL
ncbi:MAG TPA: J domain-containing protein [Anaerolineae bacterium]|nr:J domain-containing protein [Anaerolineae bacterium]